MIDLVRSLMVGFAVVAAGCSSGNGGGDDNPDRPDGGGFDTPDGDDNPTHCGSDVIDMPTTVACAAVTRTCIEACTTDDCPDNCITADPDPDNCGVCLEDGWLSCVNTMGCQAEWDAVNCCYEACPDPESAACEASCSAEENAYDSCSEAYEEVCSTNADAICYPP